MTTMIKNDDYNDNDDDDNTNYNNDDELTRRIVSNRLAL